ncbi:hypothetical protein [Arthrobacter bambusae]|uniref:Uncharacterized protein n=1 Tax=Arthrobacter bambusae TaxID=1338426 RepID=A0AAW8DIV9_9MICC|nr:hypothetical protein [Arthrobacter bambusae]MDP9905611.1 hypothetical protein [Arthrobacter bambusae]MDQ0127307.1 hypothetical protein [Arthrobacter bambusae]MDQ0178649.1 hypothetical protein [Arthrobacter bambusae]
MIFIPSNQSGAVRILAKTIGRQIIYVQIPSDGLKDSQIVTFTKAFYESF